MISIAEREPQIKDPQKNIRINQKQLSLKLAKIGIFAAVYVVTSFFPLSFFIGFGSSLLTLALIMVPVMAVLLRPEEGFSASLIGGFVTVWAVPQSAPFQLFSILLPVTGVTVGSLVFHYPQYGGIITILVLGSTMIAFLLAIPEFPWWVIPHGIALVIAIGLVAFALPSFSGKVELPLAARVVLTCYIATMCEQAVMMVLASYYLLLPWPVFTAAFLLMLYERLVATIGGFILSIAVLDSIPHYFPTTQ